MAVLLRSSVSGNSTAVSIPNQANGISTSAKVGIITGALCSAAIVALALFYIHLMRRARADSTTLESASHKQLTPKQILGIDDLTRLEDLSAYQGRN